MYHVVVGVGDDTDRELPKVRAIADLPHSADELQVTLVHVADADEGPADAEETPTVERVRSFLADRGIETRLATVEGTPWAAVLDTAAEVDADLVCVGGRRRSPAGKMQLRTGAESVILNAPCPVLVAGGPDDDDGPRPGRS